MWNKTAKTHANKDNRFIGNRYKVSDKYTNELGHRVGTCVDAVCVFSPKPILLIEFKKIVSDMYTVTDWIWVEFEQCHKVN